MPSSKLEFLSSFEVDDVSNWLARKRLFLRTLLFTFLQKHDSEEAKMEERTGKE